MPSLTHVIGCLFVEIYVQLLGDWESLSFNNGLFQCLVSGFLRFVPTLLA